MAHLGASRSKGPVGCSPHESGDPPVENRHLGHPSCRRGRGSRNGTVSCGAGQIVAAKWSSRPASASRPLPCSYPMTRQEFAECDLFGRRSLGALFFKSETRNACTSSVPDCSTPIAVTIFVCVILSFTLSCCPARSIVCVYLLRVWSLVAASPRSAAKVCIFTTKFYHWKFVRVIHEFKRSHEHRYRFFRPGF